jgi:peptidoglycan hydrolase-like protein with peptidoglycan-binding domain
MGFAAEGADIRKKRSAMLDWVRRAGLAAIAISLCTVPAAAVGASRMVRFAQVTTDAAAALPANSPEQIRKAQTELRRLDCLRSRIDGKLGEHARQAVKNFWTSAGQPAVEINITDELISDLAERGDGFCRPARPFFSFAARPGGNSALPPFFARGARPTPVSAAAVQAPSPAATQSSSRADPDLTTPIASAALPKPDADGFITLFNGHDLAGWTGLAEYWSVRDGSISGHQAKDMSRQTFLVFSGLKVTDFELRLKYRFASPEGNSGIQFRSTVIDPEAYRVGGYQADFDAEVEYDGSLYDEAGVAGNRDTLSDRGEKTIWDAENKRHSEPLGENGPDLKKSIKLGEWNDVVLMAHGNHVVYSINGRVMSELVDDAPTALRDGVLALQLHAGFTMDVRFKDVRIKVPHE